MQVSAGKVYLVGAGPGDPRLLTLRAEDLIRNADMVAYDKLISAEILAALPKGIEKVVVGRRRGGGSTEPLHPLVKQRALEGKSVVRLKCGDPLIFGRGGEEALALHAAGIPFEIIPGVTAASGAAARAMIPLTQREIASDVTLATAHRAKGVMANLVDWNSLPSRGTIVLYMVAQHLAENLKRLVAHGRLADTPCAYIENATQPSEKIITGTLADLAGKVSLETGAHAALVIIGDVVNVREKLRGKNSEFRIQKSE